MLLSALLALFLAVTTQAQTVISGPNIMTSTWTPLGSPYIVTADCTVPPGQTLTILPGTTVWMGSGTSLTGNGVIYAVGTAAQRITFQPPISSQMWNTIVINNTVGTNLFKFCDFMNATNALDFRGASRSEVWHCNFSNMGNGIVYRDNSVNTTMFCDFQNLVSGIWMTVNASKTLTQTTTITSCSFSNCSNQSIYGEAIGSHGSYYGDSWSKLLISSVRNCLFINVNAGCRYNVLGVSWSPSLAYGSGDLTLLNNVFFNVTNTAVWLTAGAYGNGPAVLMNNTVVNARDGIVVQDQWDARIQNNSLKGCGIGVTRSGSLSANVSYNDLFSNATNFAGYPLTYGQVILANRNGTPSDVLFNIFQDPQFVSETDFHLQAGSPCIDAGEGSGANFDSYFPPSTGSITNDIGAYGGPNAGQWIVPASTNTFTLGITEIPHVSVTVNPPSPGHYRLEYSTALLGTNTWIQITNLDLTTVPFTYTEPAADPARFYRAVKQ